MVQQYTSITFRDISLPFSAKIKKKKAKFKVLRERRTDKAGLIPIFTGILTI